MLYVHLIYLQQVQRLEPEPSILHLALSEFRFIHTCTENRWKHANLSDFNSANPMDFENKQQQQVVSI